LHTIFENNLGLFKVSIVGALVNPNIDERLEYVEGDPLIANLKSLNGVEIEELGGLTEEGNFVFT
jgi:hypothetical protein